jgi:hypothetical protein
MTQQNTWLAGLEVAQLLAIRPDRVAQLMRVGILPYVTAVDGPLVHKRDLKNLTELFPDLLRHFQVENEVDSLVEDGDFRWEPQSYTRPSTVKLLACVKRREPTFPS